MNYPEKSKIFLLKQMTLVYKLERAELTAHGTDVLAGDLFCFAIFFRFWPVDGIREYFFPAAMSSGQRKFPVPFPFIRETQYIDAVSGDL